MCITLSDFRKAGTGGGLGILVPPGLSNFLLTTGLDAPLGIDEPPLLGELCPPLGLPLPGPPPAAPLLLLCLGNGLFIPGVTIKIVF